MRSSRTARSRPTAGRATWTPPTTSKRRSPTSSRARSDSLDIAVQELDSPEIAQALLDARWRGVDVKIVLEQDNLVEAKLPKPPPKRQTAETPEAALRRWQWTPAKIKLYTPRTDIQFSDPEARFRKLHHKLRVIDRHTVIAGSFNYTAPADHYNDENLFVIGSAYAGLPTREGGPVNKDRCARLADYMRKEIERIVSAASPGSPSRASPGTRS